MSRTFVLGVGAQKGGTSWLYQQLAQCRGFQTGWMKEYHIWDVREVPVLKSGRRKIWKIKTLRRLQMYLMERFPARYFTHFEELLSDENSLACDLTPSYSALSPETLLRIKQGMVDRGIDFKCVFIMRDPVRRCLSAFNMNRNRGEGREGVAMSEDVDDAFMRYVRSDHAKIRTEYQRTIAALKAGLAPEDYQILIFEEMFAAPQLEVIQSFLGVTFEVEATQKRVFATQYNTDVSEEALAFCRSSFAATYDEVGRAFPQVKELWSAGRPTA